METWCDALPGIIMNLSLASARIETERLRVPVNAYLVPSFDRDALQFSLPILVPRDLPGEFTLDGQGIDGAVSAIIEGIKTRAGEDRRFGPLVGAAPNLLVPSCLQEGEVEILSTLLARDPGTLGDTSLVFAAGALDILVARASRILVLEDHRARAIPPPGSSGNASLPT